MKEKLIAVLLLIAGVSFGDWLYNKSAKTLTECDSSGVALAESPWIFSVAAKSMDGDVTNISIGRNQVGATSELDLQAAIHGDKAAIIGLDGDCFNYNLTKVYLTKIKLPLSLTSIGYNCFYGQKQMVHVEPFLPEGVNNLAAGAFQNAGVTNSLRYGYCGGTMTMGASCMFQGTAIDRIDAGPAVGSMPQSTFKDCKNLRDVRLSEGLKTIGASAFAGCTAITNISPFLPDSVTSIGQQALHTANVIPGTFSFVANNEDASINADCISIGAVTNICFGDGNIYIDNNALTSVANVKTVRFGKGVLSLHEHGMWGFRVNSYATRFEVPVGISAWETFIADHNPTDWADIPETGNNPSKEKYYGAFPDGPEPRCLIGIYGYGGTRYVWIYSYSLGGEGAKELYVSGASESGEELLVGETSPAYGEYPNAGDSLPMTCSAPEYVTDGALTEYKCVGYRIEKLNEAYEWELESEVKDGARSYTFNPEEAGATRLTWLWEVSGYNVAVALPAIEGLGSVTLSDKDHGDFYLKDRVVEISAVGDTFVRWFGDVPESDAFNRTINLKMDGGKSLLPYFAHDWVRSGNYITDGYWTIKVAVSSSKMTIQSPTVNWAPGFLDLSKPVQSGEIIVEIGQNALKENKVLTDLRLPDTIIKVNSSSLYNCTNLKNVSPFVPDSLVTFNDWCFRSCGITNALVIGGNLEKTYSFGVYAFSECKIPELTIKEGLTSIKAHTFSYLYDLRVLRFEGDYPTMVETAFTRGGDIAKYSKMVQMYIPGELPGWKTLVEECVTPWKEVSDADKEYYFQIFGVNAPVPDGLFVEANHAKCLGQLGSQWYFNTSSNKGLLMIIR